MTNTTISGIVLDGDGNTVIDDNTCNKEAILSPLPLYTEDSDGTDVFDFGGVIKTITLTGTIKGVNRDAVKDFIDSIELLIQGHQDTDAGYPLILVDDLRGTIKVKVQSLNSSQIGGQPIKASWTLKLIESSDNS